eukprot:SAG31_NODE_3247_length_4493_cov_3.475876_3_plen_261_part_00
MQSDWGACHSTVASITHGMDIEMPNAKFLTAANIQEGLANKTISMAQVDDSCQRILRSYFSVPKAMRIPGPCGGGDCIDDMVKSPQHIALARKLSAMSTVLLKNENELLPLSRTEMVGKKLLLIGPGAAVPYTGGSGSGAVSNASAVSPLTAFKALKDLDVSYHDGSSPKAAADAAKSADIAIVFGSAATGEGHDRLNLNLDGNIDQVIPAVGEAQKNTIVVLSTPGSILTDWRAGVGAILYNGLPGEQAYSNSQTSPIQ